MGKQIIAKKGGKTAKKIALKYTINCKLPIEDNVIVLNDFENFLKQRIKVDGKAGNLGSAVTVAKDSSSIVVQSSIPFSKRYLKYLSKKYLKKQDLKEYLRVVATGKNQYELRYFNIQAEDQADRDRWTGCMRRQLQTQLDFLKALQAPIAYHNSLSKEL